MMADSDTAPTGPVSDEGDGVTVLDLFGIKLSVQNPRIAQILTMEAGEALTTDVRDLLDPAEVRADRSAATQAAPDVVMTPPTSRDAADSKLRADIRARADAIGEALGFETGPAGVWESPSGISIITRVVEHPLSFAAAADYVGKLSTVLEGRDNADTTALFIVDSQQTADVFKVAIRQRRLYDVARTISAENLETIRSLFGSAAIDHSRVLVLLTPMANADVGEVLNIIRSAGAGDHYEGPEY